MSNQRSPNEDDAQRVSDIDEPVDLPAAQGLQEEVPTTSTLPANRAEEAKQVEKNRPHLLQIQTKK